MFCETKQKQKKCIVQILAFFFFAELHFPSRQRRVGWFKCSCGGGRDQLRGHPMSFVLGLQGNQVATHLGSWGSACVALQSSRSRGLLLCGGQTALHSSSSRAHEEREKGSAEIVRGLASSLLVHPFNLGNKLCVWWPKLGIRPTSRAEKQDRDKTGIIITARLCWVDMNIQTVEEQWKNTKEKFSPLRLWLYDCKL